MAGDVITIAHKGIKLKLPVKVDEMLYFLYLYQPQSHIRFHAGLCIRVRLTRSLPQRFKIDMRVKPGSHQSEQAGKYIHCRVVSKFPTVPIVNKQLNDKERVAAALENPALLEVVEKCLSTANRRGLVA